MVRGRQGKGFWYGFRRKRRGAPAVEPLRFWGKKPKRRWRRYLPMWGGAAAVGLVVGSMFGPLPRADEGEAEPIAWNEVQGVPQAPARPEDGEWARRAVNDGGSAGAVRASFGLCHSGGGRNCVVDGDTIWLEGQNIRIADIDTPETHEPRCRREKALGERATRRLHELVNSGQVSLQGIGRDSDIYGRKLRVVLVDGTSVGETLVDEGLARRYGSGRRSWCS